MSSLNAHTNFMDNPLVVWVKTFADGDITFKDITDGVFLNNVFSQIDYKANVDGLLIKVDQVKHRLQNWDILLRNIRIYYQDVLQQLIVMPHPDIFRISKEPESDSACIEINRVLLLLLGCSVQCEHKEEFIQTIETKLDVGVQYAIVDVIKGITEESKNVISLQLPNEESTDLTCNMHDHLLSLVNERDCYIEEIKVLTLTIDELYVSQQAEVQRQVMAYSSKNHASPDPKNNHTLELAELKDKLRKVRQELEERTEQVNEYAEEIETLQKDNQKYLQQNRILVQDARSARTYRDELDIWKEKAQRVDKYEADNLKLRNKLNELDYFKTRVEELREDNKILDETRAMLEEKLSDSSKRFERVIELENDLLRYKEKVELICKERDECRAKMQDLIGLNARLEFEKKSSFTESATLEEELSRAKASAHAGLSRSLGDQLKDSSNAVILRLQMENNNLTKQLAEIKENSALESAQRLMEVEKENARLSRKVESMQEVHSKENQEILSLEEKTEKLNIKKIDIEKTLETVRENSARQIKELKDENEQLILNLTTLRKRSEKSNDFKVQEMEKENVRLQDSVREITTKLTELEYERKRRLSLEEKLLELQEENDHMDKEFNDLNKKVSKMKIFEEKCDKYEQEITDLEANNRRNEKIIENMRSRIEKAQEAEKENLTFSTENERLNKCLVNLKQQSISIIDFEQEKDELNREIKQLKALNEINKQDKITSENLKGDLLRYEAENRKLRKSLQDTSTRLEKVWKEKADLESDFEETTKIQQRIEQLENELEKCELENSDLLNDKSMLENENRQLRRTIKQNDRNIDEERCKFQDIERELKQVKQTADRCMETKSRLSELESDNASLEQKSVGQGKEINVLRQDLVNEKIKSQKLRNDLENLQKSFNKVNFIHESTQNASINDDDKFKSLENLVHKEFKKSLDIKEEKIHALDSRLSESINRNVQLQDQLRSVQRDYNGLMQRVEEEKLFSNSNNDSKQQNVEKGRVHFGNEVLQLKDHLIKVERANATLESEKHSLFAQNNTLQKRVNVLESNQAELHKSLSASVSRFEILQRQTAQLQVDERTLQSRLTSSQQQLNVTQQTKNSISNELEKLLRKYEKLQSDNEKLENLNLQLNRENERVVNEYSSNRQYADSELKRRNEQLLIELEKSKRLNYELEEATREAVEQVREADMEICKLSNKIESLEQMICKLEDDNRGLMQQLQTVLSQNQDLLTTLLQSKDNIHEEQRQYMEKLSDLRRQKEKLEEKIIDQYKRYEPSPKRKSSFAATLVRKARGMIRSKSREWGKGSEFKEEENSSFGSESYGSSSMEENALRRGLKKLTPSPLSKNKTLARSTNAINAVGNGYLNDLRSAKSSENLYPDQVNGWNNNSSHSKRKNMNDSSVSANVNEDETNEQISLSQFLNESNKSPKSRRKYLKENRVDLSKQQSQSDLREKDLAYQDPRSATIDVDNDEIMPLKSRAKSEMNITINKTKYNRPHSVMGMPNTHTLPTANSPTVNQQQYYRPKSAIPYEYDQPDFNSPQRPIEREVRQVNNYTPNNNTRQPVKNYQDFTSQSYQEATNRQSHHPPDPPPRRVRPNIGNNTSAFSRPSPTIGDTQIVEQVRKLPSTPGSNAGSTPPRTDGKKKQGVWYEYGCV